MYGNTGNFKHINVRSAMKGVMSHGHEDARTRPDLLCIMSVDCRLLKPLDRPGRSRAPARDRSLRSFQRFHSFQNAVPRTQSRHGFFPGVLSFRLLLKDGL